MILLYIIVTILVKIIFTAGCRKQTKSLNKFRIYFPHTTRNLKGIKPPQCHEGLPAVSSSVRPCCVSPVVASKRLLRLQPHSCFPVKRQRDQEAPGKVLPFHEKRSFSRDFAYVPLSGNESHGNPCL